MSLKAQEWDQRVDGMARALAQALVTCWPTALALAFTLLLAGIFSAPVLRAWSWDGPASLVYAVGGLVCHQLPERSFFVAGFPAAVCARDTGILLGMALAAWICGVAVWRRRDWNFPLWGLALAAVPAAVDGGSQMLGLWESINSLRLVSGTLLGAALILFVFPYLERGFSSPVHGTHA